MNLLHMPGAWGPGESRLYAAVVAGSAGPLYARAAERLLHGIAPRAVLDVGCGPGHAAVEVARRLPAGSVLGVDLSPAMASAAAAQARREGVPNADFEVGDATALRAATGTFDLVYSLASIKHWPDPVAGLREMDRARREGGRLVVVEADRGASWEAVRRFADRWRLVPGALASLYFRNVVAGQSFDMEDAAALARKAGLADARVEREEGWPFWSLVA